MSSPDWTCDPRDRDLRTRIERELPALMALARRLTRSEQNAQDAMQDALERAWRTRGTLRDHAATSGWRRTILARSVVDAHRRSRSDDLWDPAAMEELIPDVADPADLVEAVEEEPTVRAALRALVPSDRGAVVLHDAEEWSAVELAELLGISTDAAHKRIQRARARLIGALARERNSVATAPTAGCHDARAQALPEPLQARLSALVRAADEAP